MLKVTISGVRGIVDESLTDEVVLDFAKAFATYSKNGKIVVGSDTRKSGEKIKELVSKGLTECGCNVVDLGIVTTPTVGILIGELEAAGGMVITASHNPNPWNGLKFIGSDGIFLAPQEFEKMVGIYKNKNFVRKEGGSVDSFKKANETHISKIINVIDLDKINSKRFKIVVDSCNGAGGRITPELLKELGCEVIVINDKVGEDFPHGPEPSPENLKELSETVIKNKADIGFAQDPDADRLSIVTEKGAAISEEYTLAIAAEYILSKNARTGRELSVATNLSTSSLIDDVAKKYQGKVIRTKIGEVYVATKIKEKKILIGGEGNGGVIYPKVGYNRDSLTGIALILNCMADKNIPISQLVDSLPKYFLAKTKIDCQSLEEAQSILAKAEETFKNEIIDKTEGVKILFSDAWIHLRASNTEPVLRIFSEAKEKERAESLNRQVLSKLKV